MLDCEQFIYHEGRKLGVTHDTNDRSGGTPRKETDEADAGSSLVRNMNRRVRNRRVV